MSDAEKVMVRWELHQRQGELSLSMSDCVVSRKEAEVELMTTRWRQVFARPRQAMEELTSWTVI